MKYNETNKGKGNILFLPADEAKTMNDFQNEKNAKWQAKKGNQEKLLHKFTVSFINLDVEKMFNFSTPNGEPLFFDTQKDAFRFGKDKMYEIAFRVAFPATHFEIIRHEKDFKIAFMYNRKCELVKSYRFTED